MQVGPASPRNAVGIGNEKEVGLNTDPANLHSKCRTAKLLALPALCGRMTG